MLPQNAGFLSKASLNDGTRSTKNCQPPTNMMRGYDTVNQDTKMSNPLNLGLNKKKGDDDKEKENPSHPAPGFSNADIASSNASGVKKMAGLDSKAQLQQKSTKKASKENGQKIHKIPDAQEA